MEFSKLTFLMAFVLLIQYGQTKEVDYNITMTSMEYINGTKDCCFDFANLVFADDDITGSFDLLVDISQEMTNYEGQILLSKKNEQTSEYEPELTMGPEPWCQLYSKLQPLLDDLKKITDLPPKCPVTKGTYIVKETPDIEDDDETIDLPRGEYMVDCTLLIDGQIVSGVRGFIKITDK